MSPYVLRDKDGRQIVVFFRDQEVSDQIGFQNNFLSKEDADSFARDLVIKILEKAWLSNETYKSYRVFTIALDGENWMIFSKTPPNAALFLDYFYGYLEQAQRDKALMTCTAKEALTFLSQLEFFILFQQIHGLVLLISGLLKKLKQVNGNKLNSCIKS
jgi:Alpha-amylase/alpha-mannosidase